MALSDHQTVRSLLDSLNGFTTASLRQPDEWVRTADAPAVPRATQPAQDERLQHANWQALLHDRGISYVGAVNATLIRTDAHPAAPGRLSVAADTSVIAGGTHYFESVRSCVRRAHPDRDAGNFSDLLTFLLYRLWDEKTAVFAFGTDIFSLSQRWVPMAYRADGRTFVSTIRAEARDLWNERRCAFLLRSR